jgi:hypothetical protein
MKYLYKTIICITLFLSFTPASSQIETLEFTLNSNTISIADEDVLIESTLTKTEDSIIWTQLVDGATEVTTFTIDTISGSWDETTSIGSINYQMTIEDYQANLILTGTASGISATLIFIISPTQVENYTFTINAITYQ